MPFVRNPSRERASRLRCQGERSLGDESQFVAWCASASPLDFSAQWTDKLLDLCAVGGLASLARCLAAARERVARELAAPARGGRLAAAMEYAPLRPRYFSPSARAAASARIRGLWAQAKAEGRTSLRKS